MAMSVRVMLCEECLLVQLGEQFTCGSDLVEQDYQ